MTGCRRTFVRLALPALLAGCEPQAIESISARPNCPLPALQLPPAGVPSLLIDDMEDGTLRGAQSDGLEAAWESWADETVPPPQVVGVSNACAALGAFALRAASTHPHEGWGGSTNLFFVGAPRPKPYDGRNWNALSFYLALSPETPSPRTLKVGISTMDTAWKGRCTTCMDTFSARIVATTRWQRFVLRFADLRQEGWGDPQTTFKPDEIVQFHVGLEKVYHVWVDHVRFEALP